MWDKINNNVRNQFLQLVLLAPENNSILTQM